MDRRSLAVCAVFRNGAPYLLEWIAYHRVIGFDRFILYDNGSTDGGVDLIRRSPLAERVTVIHWPQRPGLLSAYRHFIDIFAPAYDWVAFIDPDEFILPLPDSTLQETLRRCAPASAVLVNWRVFGPAGHEEPASGLAIETYHLRAEDSLPVNRYVKSLVRCADLLDVGEGPHVFRLKGAACNPVGQEVPNEARPPVACHQGLVINRYHTRSRRDWLGRLDGDDMMPIDAGPGYTEDVFDHLAAVCRIRDDAIIAYAPRVRSLLVDHAAAIPQAEAVAAPAAAAHPASAAFVLGDAGLAMQADKTPDVSPPGRTDQPASEEAPPITAAYSVPQAIPALARHAAEWRASGADAQERSDGLALVFRDRSRRRAAWLAALRGRAAGLINPDFLLDELGRLREFPTDQEARAACEAALIEFQLA